MKPPYRARTDERHFLNLPGHHAGAFVNCYVEDTSERGLVAHRYQEGELYNPEPRIVCEMADCCNRITLEFDLTSAEERQNSFHKIDTLIAALESFRDGLAAESTLYKQRERQLEQHRAEREVAKQQRPADLRARRHAA